jgi:dTDP-4-amino-4,6-dideoxygalactose transaminase
MSEYHAAVGLASLDAWVATRQDFMRVAQLYRNRLAASNAVALPEGLGRDWVASTIVAQVPETARDAVLRAFDAAAIGYRMWWGDGCHTAPAFRQCPRDPLPVTRQLSVTSIGLPCFQDMSREQVDVVCDVLLGAIRH